MHRTGSTALAEALYATVDGVVYEIDTPEHLYYVLVPVRLRDRGVDAVYGREYTLSACRSEARSHEHGVAMSPCAVDAVPSDHDVIADFERLGGPEKVYRSEADVDADSYRWPSATEGWVHHGY